MNQFSEKDLVSFGNYLLSDERKERFQATFDEMKAQGLDPLPVEERLKAVYDADLANWKHEAGYAITSIGTNEN